jgi:hypothetical protein
MKFTSVILLSAALLLGWATAMPLLIRMEAEDAVAPDLIAIFAKPTPSWETKDLPIGETESVKLAAEQNLRYDHYFFRSYRKGTTEFTIYVAYWLPGKQPPHLITQHVPDRCWTMNGMTCEEMRFEVPIAIGTHQLWPAQWRQFRNTDGKDVYTMFWHTVGGRPYNFGRQFYAVPHAGTFWFEAFRYLLGSRPEQLFFRVTSNSPIDALWKDPELQEVMAGFLKLGMAAGPVY